ncbi:MAG: hypothetical protein HY327_06760, partial [Chloroflexi bacterium]|nr:hypothetical protein [Chloroflexota bacterium]
MRPRLILLLVIGLGLVALFALTNRRRALPLAIHTIRADDSTLQTARELGASHIVQVFTWREIQPSPAEFHWEYSDWLVRAAEYYDLRVIARLDKAPRWAVAGEMTADAPPAQLEDFANFAGRVAARYRGRIAAYIIWNEPNLAIEWGNRAPNPGEYAELLRVTSARLRTADPRALVLAAGLAPTNENHAGAMDDRDFLRGLYAAGARDAFDALAAHPYPFTYAPDDPRGAHAALNFQRLWDWRAIMIAAGD